MRRMELVVLLAGLMLALGVVEGPPMCHCELLLVEAFVLLRRRKAFRQKSTGLSSDLATLPIAAGPMLFKMLFVPRSHSKCRGTSVFHVGCHRLSNWAIRGPMSTFVELLFLSKPLQIPLLHVGARTCCILLVVAHRRG